MAMRVFVTCTANAQSEDALSVAMVPARPHGPDGPALPGFSGSPNPVENLKALLLAFEAYRAWTWACMRPHGRKRLSEGVLRLADFCPLVGAVGSPSHFPGKYATVKECDGSSKVIRAPALGASRGCGTTRFGASKVL